MEGHAEGILKDLADTCADGAFVFRETAKDTTYCSLILTDTGVHSICPHADEESTMVTENGLLVARHRCLAPAPIPLDIAPSQ